MSAQPNTPNKQTDGSPRSPSTRLSGTWPWVKEESEKTALHVWVPVLATALLAVAGLSGSLWTVEIRESFPIRWFAGRPGLGTLIPLCGPSREWTCHWELEAVVFWICALGGSTLFGIREWAKARSDERVQVAIQDRIIEGARQASDAITGTGQKLMSELEERTHALAQQGMDLHERARTLPPPEFLAGALDAQISMLAMLKSSLLKKGTESAEILLDEARQALLACLRLAVLFERPERKAARWAANLMLFVPVDDVNDETLASFKADCPYTRLSFAREELSGVLVPRMELSVMVEVTAEGESDPTFPDPGLRPIALPVPQAPVTPSGRRLLVIPGAPYALCANTPSGYADTADLGRTAEKYCDLPQGTADQIRARFSEKESPHIRSLISIPLLRAPTDIKDPWIWQPEDEPQTLQHLPRPGDRPAGVLNIHRNQENMACADERIFLFYPILVPLIHALRDLVELQDEALSRCSGELGSALAGTTDHLA